VQCVGAIAPGDLQTDYFIANTNCGLTGTPLAYTEAQFLALAPSVTSSTSSTTTSISSTSSSVSSSTVTSSSSTISNTPTPPSALGGITATVNGKPLSTGAIVGIVIALLVCLGLVAVAIALCCIHLRRKRERQAMQPGQHGNIETGFAGPQTQAGPTEYGKVGEGITTAPVLPLAGPNPTGETMKTAYPQQPYVVDPAGYRQGQQQIDPSEYQPGQQQVDPRYSMYSNATTAAPAYPFQSESLPAYAPGQQQVYHSPGQFPSPGSTVISPLSGTGSSPRPGYIEIDSSESVPVVSPPTTTSAPVELSATAQNQHVPEAQHIPDAQHGPEPTLSTIPETNVAITQPHGTGNA